MSKKGFTNQQGGISGIAERIASNALGQVAGVVSTKPTAKYATGARTILKINNKIAGFAFSVSWNINTEVVENRTIDDYLPYELIPNRITVEGTMSGFHIPGQGASAQLIQADVLGFLFHKYITIEVRDSATDELLFYTNKAMITSRMEDLSAEQIGRVQLRWKAIGWKDERDPQYPDGFDLNKGDNEQSAASRLIDKGKEVFNKAKGIFGG